MKIKVLLSILFVLLSLNATEKKKAKIHPSFGLSPSTEVILKQIKKANPDGTYVLNENDINALLTILTKADIAIKATVENITNAKTIGYKRIRTIDLISNKRGLQLQRSFSLGNLVSTGHKLDIAIASEIGFLAFKDDKKQIFYSRDGSLKIGTERTLLNSFGHKLIPEIQFESDDIIETLNISEDGVLSISNSSKKNRKIDQLRLFQFQNTSDLIYNKLYNCFSPINDSIKAQEKFPGQSGMGVVLQGFLELSNVNITEEQRDYLSFIRFYNLIYDSISRLDPSFVGAYKTHIFDPSYIKNMEEGK
ncbi:MAG: flagellar hook basal-body protein [Leptospiraceae bacterium]|nr:flagellar hook basal-body protein [Leptospiraceae bacterium]